jgi:hypothetical protein
MLQLVTTSKLQCHMHERVQWQQAQSFFKNTRRNPQGICNSQYKYLKVSESKKESILSSLLWELPSLFTVSTITSAMAVYPPPPGSFEYFSSAPKTDHPKSLRVANQRCVSVHAQRSTDRS